MAHSKHIALATALLCGASAPAACTACSSGGGTTAAGARDAGSPVGGDAGDATAPVRDAGAPDVFAADASTDAAVLLADAGILSDPSVWTPTPIGSTCSLYTANVPPDPFPPRVWQACGAGCQVSASALPIAGIPGSSSLSSLGHSGGTCVNGDIFLLIDMGFAPSVGTVDVVEQLFRLSDGTTFSAAELRGVSANCGVSATVVDAPGALSLSTGTSVLLGRSSLAAPGPIAWQKSWLPEPSIELFRFADTDGIGLTYYDDAVRIVGSQDAGAWTVVSSNGHSVEDTSSHGGLVVWCEWSGSGGTVQGYASASGAATYVSQPGYWQSVARVSDERLTWISVNGPNVTSGAYTSAQFFWSPVPTAPSDVVVTSGPTIPATSVLSDLAVGGDYAAVTGCAGTAASCKIYVLQFSTQKMWALGPRPGGNNAFAAVLAAGPNEIVLAETDATSNGHQGTFTRIVRVATSALDGLGW